MRGARGSDAAAGNGRQVGLDYLGRLLTEDSVATLIEELTAQALRLSPSDREMLLCSLIASIDGEPQDTPEAIARAWDEEIVRRLADLETGKTTSVPAEEVFARIRALIAGHGSR